jgi:hypothetical protein
MIAMLHRRSFWLLLVILFAVVMALAGYADYVFTGQRPNPAFYLVIPPVAILAEAVCIAGPTRLLRLRLHFPTVLAIVVVVNVLMEVLEIVEKAIYYNVWEYPGLLYIIANLVLSTGLVAAALVKLCAVSPRRAVLLALVGFFGSLVAAGLASSLTGISTPGS